MAKARDSASDPLVESEEDSGAEEESSSEEEGTESESEPEPEPPRTQVSQPTTKPTPIPASNKPEPQPSKTQPEDSSSDDGESELETDSDTPVKKPDLNTKPMADAQKPPTTKKPGSKPNTCGPTSQAKPTPAAGAKRCSSGAADGDVKEAKRSKKKLEMGVEDSEEKGNSNDDAKKLFQRVWSEDDEIAILKGMNDYEAKKGADPFNDLNDFHEFIKKSLHVDVSKQQLQDKIRRLKKKYKNNEKKGKGKVSAKPHEQMSYELSKKIWGKESVGGDHTIESPKVNRTPAKMSRSKNALAVVHVRDETLKEDKNVGGEKSVEGLKGVHIGLGSAGIEGWMAKYGLEGIKGKKREELEEKWEKLNVEEIEIYGKKLELMLELTKSVLEAVKSSGQ